MTRRVVTVGVVALAMSGLMGRPGGKLTVYSTYPGGRLRVLRGESDHRHERMGLWVYYALDGTVQYEYQRPDGSTFVATGVFEHGRLVRLPTDDELALARERADEIERSLSR